MIFHIGMDRRQHMIDSKKLIKQNMLRLIQTETQLHELVALLDIGISGVYDSDEVFRITALLTDTLGQFGSDLSAIVTLIDD